MQAMEAAPEASLPHVAACISMGRLALLSENKAKASAVTAAVILGVSKPCFHKKRQRAFRS